MTFILFAYNEMGYACLEELIHQKQKILCLVTHSYDKDSALKTPETLAKKYNIPILYIHNSEDLNGLFFNEKPDFILSCYFKYIIPDSILYNAKKAAFNFHGSLLPFYRGRCPVNWAIINGEEKTGVTLHHMVSRVDAGDIVAQKEIPILQTDCAGDVTKKMIVALKDILKHHIPFFEKNRITRHPMNIDQGSYYGGRRPCDGEIVWTKSSFEIYNLIRALQPSPPYPPAWAINTLGKILFYKACIPDQKIYPVSVPGDFIIEKNKLIFSCGENGEERITIEDFEFEG